MASKKSLIKEEKNKKSENNLPRINISISPELKVEWDTFAKESNMSTASLIRLSVQDYMKRERKTRPESQQDSMTQRIQGLEKQLNEKMNEIQSLFKQLPKSSNIPEDDKDRIKTQVIALLEDHPAGIEPKLLSKYCVVDREEMNLILEEMQEYSAIKMDKGKFKLGETK
jgi:CRP-like cAMP-binding protein